MRLLLLTLAMVLAMAAPASAGLHATLKSEAMWETYKTRFIGADGRVVDNANGNVSHSEGQGFAMLLAVAADDPKTFARVWSFARNELAVRDDALFAWRWTPDATGGGKVSDTNNATDGDLLIAWALLEAADAGFGEPYRAAAQAIIEDLPAMTAPHDAHGLLLRPAAFGFSAKEQGGRQVVNPSYWVFPALDRLKQTSQKAQAHALISSGLNILSAADHLPPDWLSVHATDRAVAPAKKFGPLFSYNAVRVPLYLAWSGHINALQRVMNRWRAADASRLVQVNVTTGKADKPFADAGYAAIAAFADCRLSGARFPARLRATLDPLYYPASLHLLSIAALKQKVPQCW